MLIERNETYPGSGYRNGSLLFRLRKVKYTQIYTCSVDSIHGSLSRLLPAGKTTEKQYQNMSYTETTYSKADLREDSLRREYETDPSTAARIVRGAKNEEAMRYLIEEVKIDKQHEQDQHLGDIKRAILESDVCPDELKQVVSTRGDETPAEVFVPNDVQQDAAAAINTGKPLVLYGPTGTGKTTFAKQLARETGIGYTLNTATLICQSWLPGPRLMGLHARPSLCLQISPEQVQAERRRRLALGFDYDFGDARGIHTLATTEKDMEGWAEVTQWANAMIAKGKPGETLLIATETGPATPTVAPTASVPRSVLRVMEGIGRRVVTPS